MPKHEYLLFINDYCGLNCILLLIANNEKLNFHQNGINFDPFNTIAF